MTKIVATNLDLLGNELQRVRLESRNTAPASPQPGQFWFDAIQGKFVFRGTSATIEPTDRAAHHGAQPSSSISDLGPTVKAYKLNEFAVPDAPVALNAQKITGLAEGTDPTDAPNVQQLLNLGELVDTAFEQVQATFEALQPAQQVLPAAAAVATTNITLHGAPPLIDGVQTQVDQWILLTGQTDTAENGPWLLTDSTQEDPESPVVPAVWVRQRPGQPLYTYAGAFMPVALGDTYKGTLWIHDDETYNSTVGTQAPGGTWKVVGADRALHTGSQAASTISNLAVTVQAYKLNQFAAPNGAVSFADQSLTGLKDVDYNAVDVDTQAVNVRSARALASVASKYKLNVDHIAETFISAAMFAGNEDYGTENNGVPAPGATVLAVAQSDETENGLWVAGGFGGNPWTRVPNVTLSPGEAVYVLADKSVWQYVGVNVVEPADAGTAYQTWRPFLNTALGRALYKKTVNFVAVRPVDTSATTPQDIDGNVVTGGRVLLTHQNSTYDNGLWKVATTFVDGSPVTTWSRVDAVQSGHFEGIGAQLGETVFVLEGKHNGETWRLNSTNDGEIWRNAIDESLAKYYAYSTYTTPLDLATTEPPDLVGPMQDGDLVLLTAQTDPNENGLYSVFVSGTGVWTKLPTSRLGEQVYSYSDNQNWQKTDANVWTRMFTDVTTTFVTSLVSTTSTADRAYTDGAVAANATADRAYADSAVAANATADRAYADDAVDTAKNEVLTVVGAIVAPLQSALFLRVPARAATSTNTTLHTLPPVIDGVQLETNQWLLLLNQTDPTENGLWYIPDAADESEDVNNNALTWRRTRTPTPGVTQDIPLVTGAIVEVAEGATYSDTLFSLKSGVYGALVQDNLDAQEWEVVGSNRALHRGTQLASTISNFDAQVRTSRLDQLAVPSNDVSLASHKLTDVTPGTVGTDGVNFDQLSGVDMAVRAYADGLSTADRAYADGLSTADRAYTDTAVAGVADNSLSDFAAPTADLSIGSHKLTNVSPGTVGTDAVNLTQLNAVVAGSDARTLDQIPAAAATVDLNGQRITGLAAPSAPSDAVNRAFVEGLANGIDWKQSVRAKSTVNVAELAGTMVLDGVTLDAGDRVLLADQTDPTLNGIWVVTENTSPTTPWTRAADAAQGTLSASSAVMVEEGTTFGDSQWRLLTNDDIVVGTTPLAWTQIGAAVSYVNGAGLDLTGNVFSLMANVPRKFSAAVGDGVQTAFTINHNLGTRDVVISVYYDADGVEVECDVARTGINSVALGFAAPPDSASLRCVVVG